MSSVDVCGKQINKVFFFIPNEYLVCILKQDKDL